MKVRLEVRQENYKRIEAELQANGIEIDEEADLVLSENNSYSDYLTCKKDDEYYHIPVADIIYAESMGHDIFVHTAEMEYRYTNRLWQLEKTLPPNQFLRISNSVLINRKKIIKIRSALSQKFAVTMQGGMTVDVTRSYYYSFKNELGI